MSRQYNSAANAAANTPAWHPFSGQARGVMSSFLSVSTYRRMGVSVCVCTGGKANKRGSAQD